jgi:UDP-N-acetylglucosamine enolpyruvyl transferase
LFFNIRNQFEEEEETEKLFFHSFTEVSKLSNKILVLISHAVRQEYEIVTYLIKKKKLSKQIVKPIQNDYIPELITDKQNKKINKENMDVEETIMTNTEYQTRLMRILHIIQINLDFNLQKTDVYLHGLLR